MPTVTSDQIPGLLTAVDAITNNGTSDEVGDRAHPTPSATPLGTSVARR